MSLPRPICLLCEDEMLIGMDVEACLDEIGIAVAGPFANGADALLWSASNKADVAVIDYKLKDGLSLSLIRALQQQRIPIVIHSGCQPDQAREDISGLPWVSKPANFNTLLAVLAGAAPHLALPVRTALRDKPSFTPWSNERSGDAPVFL